MAKGIFITATGTDVGKTYISALLVKQLREIGVDCDYFKPVLSGAIVHGDEIIADDAQIVCSTAGLTGNPINRVTYAFEPAVSPHLAATMEGKEIHIEKIIEDYSRHSNTNEFTVVEGAGGIITPLDLDIQLFMYDVPDVLNLDVLIVADAGLGTINQTYLTIDFLKKANINIKGIILNNFDVSDVMHRDNLQVIELISGVKVLGTVKTDGTCIDFVDGALEKIYE